MCKVLKRFTKGNVRKSTVNFAFSGYAAVIKNQEKPAFSYERAHITEAIGSHLKSIFLVYLALVELPSRDCPFPLHTGGTESSWDPPPPYPLLVHPRGHLHSGDTSPGPKGTALIEVPLSYIDVGRRN